MKIDDFVSSILKYWQLIVIVGGIIVFTTRTQDEIRTISDALSNLNNSMKAYVDSQESTTNNRIDSLQNTVEKLHYEVVLSNQRIDTTLGKIMDMSTQTNDRLDKIWVTLYSKDGRQNK